jgi:nitric oxide reductase NorD protein
MELMLEMDGNPVATPPDIKQILQSMLLDLDEIPPEYLVAAGAGDYDAGPNEDRSAKDVWKGSHREEGALHYDEWDFRRRHYRKGWCVLREIDMRSVDKPFVAETLEKYHGLVSEIRRSFEALRGGERRLKRQPYGDDIDLEAAIEARIEAISGREMPENLFTRPQRLERDIAVIFMVDVSGSTKGWINDAERESLVLLCEALEILGDRHAGKAINSITVT